MPTQNDARVAMDAALVTAMIERLKVLYPELESDDELFRDMVEGEVDFDKTIDRVIEVYLDALSMRDAAEKRRTDIKDRADRFGRKAEAMRSLLFGLLSATNQKTVRRPLATLSVREGGSKVEITDINELPQGMFKLERVALAAEIKAAFAKDAVPGARLVASPDTLSVRTK